jgi:hypothetical protein
MPALLDAQVAVIVTVCEVPSLIEAIASNCLRYWSLYMVTPKPATTRTKNLFAACY